MTVRGKSTGPTPTNPTQTTETGNGLISWCREQRLGLKPVHNFFVLLEPWGIGFAAIGLLVAFVGLMLDLEDRQSERTFRAWEIILTSKDKNSGSAVRQALVYLNRSHGGFICANWIQSISKVVYGNNLRTCLVPQKERELFKSLKLPGTNLFKADLSGAVLIGADLSDTFLEEADLGSAVLYNASLKGAKLEFADLANANLVNTNLSGAVLHNTRNLTQTQLDTACIKNGIGPRSLPKSLTAPTRECPHNL